MTPLERGVGQAEAAARVKVLRQEGPTVLEGLQGGQCARAELLKGKLSKREKWAPGPHESRKSLGFLSVEMGSISGT